jgi:hypothetical protein
MLNGSTPYPDPASFPYIPNHYGPVGYLLTAVAIRVVGVSLFGPRLKVLLAGAIAVFVIAGLTRRLGGRWRIGSLMGVLFLSAPRDPNGGSLLLSPDRRCSGDRYRRSSRLIALPD